MKRIVLSIITIVTCLFMGSAVKAEGEKVKVYMFEAGGCPACEAQQKYLESLSSYNEKFELVKKELYVDHVDWVQGADYNLGVKVVNAFNKAGFSAGVDSTPLVVVSDIYASNGYNSSLESVILDAYEKGDKDIIACVEESREDCFPKVDNTAIVVVILVILVSGIAGLVVLANKKN